MSTSGAINTYGYTKSDPVNNRSIFKNNGVPNSYLGFLVQQKLFTFENGNIGVNFGGYKASAGLGGLLTGNPAHGGLQASAETPFGQKAAAGLGGVVDENGNNMQSSPLYSFAQVL